MAAALRCGSGSWVQFKDDLSRKNVGKNNNNNNKKGFRVSYASSSAVSDPYKTLRIKRGASESEVKKAFRQLALQYHPDVYKGSNCEVQFHQIYEAYDIVMSNLREERNTPKLETYDQDYFAYEPMRGMNDPDYELWEEWMGWEGAGIRDYSSHINPYI